VDGQAFAFEIKFPAGSQVPASAQARHVIASHGYISSLQAAKDVVLAAADDVTRQRCMRAIQAASAGACSPLQDIASAVALTRDLLDMQSLPAIKAVLDALGIAMSDASLKAVGLDPTSLKAAGFDITAFRTAGCDWATIKAAGFTASEAKAAGYDATSAIHAGYEVHSLVAAGFNAAALKAAGCGFSALVSAGFSAAELTIAGFSVEVKVSYAPLPRMLCVEFSPQFWSGCRSGTSAQDSRRRRAQGCCC
jgi:hypothetical protein